MKDERIRMKDKKIRKKGVDCRDCMYYKEYPVATVDQVERIERTAQHILDVRARYPDKSYDWLYDDATMPDDLRAAHHENDLAVMDLYGIPADATDDEIVARLFELHQMLVEEEKELRKLKKLGMSRS